jgi:hypothetical protein
MQIIPPFRMVRFEQLKRGDLFLFMDGRHQFYALKVSDARATMVMLGLSFLEDARESFLLPWDAGMVLSLSEDFSILLPTEATAWSWSGSRRTPVWLGLAGDDVFICTNGGMSPQQYFPCFVNVKTGAVVDRPLPATSVYTNHCEIAVLGANHLPRTILKFPLPEEPDTRSA